MLTTDKGNLRDVYLDWRREADEAAQMATIRAMHDPFAAQIYPGAKPAWHVVITGAGHENVASAHLVGRRFGVFDPTVQLKQVRRGRLVDKTDRLLPGYLMVFVWDIDKQLGRIRVCPGVIDILRKGDGSPAIVPDHVIDELQGKEIARNAPNWNFGLAAAYVASKAKRKKKKRYRREAIDEHDDESTRVLATSRPYDALEGIEKLEANGRKSLFNRALGIVDTE